MSSTTNPACRPCKLGEKAKHSGGVLAGRVVSKGDIICKPNGIHCSYQKNQVACLQYVRCF